MKKRNLFLSLALGMVITVMAATSAVSFAYWKSGISGNDRDSGLGITIGEGKVATTTVGLDTIQNLTGDDVRLIPENRTPVAADNEVTKIEFMAKVKWVPDWNTGDSSYDTTTNSFENMTGKLTVECTRIYIDEGGAELLDVNGYGGNPLFTCKSEFVTYNIVGNSASYVDVKISISMVEPRDRAQYDLIAGKNVKFTLTFTIESPDDLAQLED